MIPCPVIPGVLEHDWSSPQCFSSAMSYLFCACLLHPPDTLSGALLGRSARQNGSDVFGKK